MMTKIFPVITAAAVAALFLTGCQGDIDTEHVGKEQETDYISDDWEPDDLTSVECCGIEIPFPCKLSDIDESFDTKIVPRDEEHITSHDWVELYYKNEYVGAMCYDDDEYSIEEDDLTFIRLISFSWYGLTETSSKEDVQKMLGSGSKTDIEYADWYWGSSIRMGFEYTGGTTAFCAGYVHDDTGQDIAKNTADNKQDQFII